MTVSSCTLNTDKTISVLINVEANINPYSFKLRLSQFKNPRIAVDIKGVEIKIVETDGFVKGYMKNGVMTGLIPGKFTASSLTPSSDLIGAADQDLSISFTLRTNGSLLSSD